MDLLCVDKYLIGLTNSMFFIGVIISCLVIPPLADAYGRKVPFLASIGITVLVYLALIFTTNLYVAYVMIFILGLSFAGRMVVGVNYALEFFLTKAQNPALLTFMLGLNIHKLIINCWFQFIDKSVVGMLALYIVLATVLLLVLWWLVPESPKWLYVNFQFERSRRNLLPVARYNEVPQQQIKNIKSLKYDLEVMKEMQVGSDAGSIKDLNGEIAKRRDTISDGQYIANLIIMSI